MPAGADRQLDPLIDDTFQEARAVGRAVTARRDHRQRFVINVEDLVRFRQSDANRLDIVGGDFACFGWGERRDGGLEL